MSSASKTLELLDYFSPIRPEIGLSQLCRIAGRDKATTYRHLQALEDSGLVEQNPVTRHYRLGPALLQLAKTREQTVPRNAGASAPLQALADATGETSHVSVLSGKVLYRLLAVESPRHSIRVNIDIQTFPLHATASGLCTVAFGHTGMMQAALENLEAFTSQTPTQPDAVKAAVAHARSTGFSHSHGALEDGVHSIAAPIYDSSAQLAGTVAVAWVASRHSYELVQCIKENLVTASRDITHNWGGTVPIHVENAWARSPAPLQEMEHTE